MDGYTEYRYAVNALCVEDHSEPCSMYQYDASYAVDVAKAHPGRLAIVKPVNPDDRWRVTPCVFACGTTADVAG